jgi:hypothetical protein
MFHDLIEAYADAMYVATTLRSSPPARPARADCTEAREARSRGGVARRVSDWLRMRFARALGTTSKPGAPVSLGCIRPQPFLRTCSGD